VSNEPSQRAAPEHTFAVGDIHGELGLLSKLIDKLSPGPADRLVLLGDYIDRGEESRGVIDYLLGLSRRCECLFLMGNHEDMMLDYLENACARYGPLTWLLNGGTSTLDSYGAVDAADLRQMMPSAHLDFFHGLLERFEDERYIYVHAGLAPEPELESRFGTHLWIRESFIFSTKSFGKKVVFAHTPQPAPLIMANKIGLDTGAFYTGVLTALELPGEVIHQVRR
jgi:serine/threonine protein phosphatase 1